MKHDTTLVLLPSVNFGGGYNFFNLVEKKLHKRKEEMADYTGVNMKVIIRRERNSPPYNKTTINTSTKIWKVVNCRTRSTYMDEY